MTVPPYPLQWPEGRMRAKNRVTSPFRTGLLKAIENVRTSLRGFQKDAGIKIEHVVLSSDADMMTDKPRDPGVAVWFMMDGQWVCFAVDRFFDLAANVQAIHHIIEARRTELRYGGLEIVRQTFRSFQAALPAPGAKPWWQILGVEKTATLADIEAAYRKLAVERHPDRGGSDAMMAELNRARDIAKAERGNG